MRQVQAAMTFSDVGLPFSFETAVLLENLEDPEITIADLGELSLNASSKLRSLAIMALLSKGDRILFAHNLTRSGRVRLSYLDRLRRERLEDEHHGVSGRIDGQLDAVAASDLDLARKIVAASRTSWLEESEYLEDYCYAQLVHRLVTGEGELGSVEALTRQFEGALDGQPSARLEVCQTLRNRDQSGFDEAFDALIRGRQAQIEADKARFQQEEADIMAQRLIFVEGLAVLRLATLYGLRTESEYLFCPSLARLTEPVALPEL